MNEITEEDISLLEEIKLINIRRSPNTRKLCIFNLKLAKAVKELQDKQY